MLLMFDAFQESISQFIFGTGLLEWCGVFTGILCVWLAAKNNIWNWPIAIVSVIIYIFIFFDSKLYADMGLQFYFFGMNIYGWYFWSKQRNNKEESFPFIDSFCTACSLIAQVFLARKVLQNWLIWIFVDAIYVGVYFSKDLYATGLMYALYIVIATIGYLDWKKIYREQIN